MKTFIKRILLNLSNHVKQFKDGLDIFRGFVYDYRYYMSTNYISTSNIKDKLSAKIMLTMHELEKGMSFKKNPREFGDAKANFLTDSLKKYKSLYGIDELYITSLNILNEYYKDAWSTKKIETRAKLESLLYEDSKYIVESMTGVKTISKPHPFNESAILDFFISRSSVRDYSDQDVLPEEIQNAINFAKVTPTACNRQSCRVYYYNDKVVMNKIIENQLGNQGWCDRAKGIIVVTSNQSLFGKSYERSQALIDGGLYAMNLVYGLHLQRIASCFKMYVREPKREKQFRTITGVAYNEIPIVLILVGHYKEDCILEPKSHRFDNYTKLYQ